MWNKLRSLRMQRRLVVALLLSLLVHAWLVGGFDGWLPEEDAPEVNLIQVELQPPPKPLPAPVPARAEPTAKPRSQPAKPVPPPPAPAETPPPAAVEVPSAPAVEPAPLPVAAVPEPPPDEPAPVVEETTEPAPKTPGKVAIEYQIVRKGGVAGVEHHRFEVDADGRYVLTSLAEAKGLLALALSDLVQRSEGTVTPHGLRPDSFLYQYGSKAEKAQKAGFDWASHELTLQTGSRSQTVPLADGTQDLMSFLYQFMFVPPLQNLQLAVTNGKKLKVYNYGFEGEETLQTKMGPVRALHIAKSGSDGEEKTEVWLAADYHYLPVKISKTEKDGTVTERIATSLQIQE